MPNLANELDPTTWDEFMFHERQVKNLRGFIERNDHPSAITFSGHTGSGKTSSCRLYLKSLFCLNRAVGTSNPCNSCAMCKLDARTAGASNNMIWIQKGKDDSLTAQFSKALEEAFMPPYGMADADRYYKAIVFDELQTVDKAKLQELLFFPELDELKQKNRVVFIFLTMNEESINADVFRALVDRTFYLQFRPLSEGQILQYLAHNFKNMPSESASMIARYAQGSIRRALRGIERCMEEDKYLTPLIVAETLYYASASTRQYLWNLIANFDRKGLRAWWKENEPKFDPDALIGQMLEDLEEVLLETPTQELVSAQNLIFNYLTSRARVRPLELLLVLVQFKLKIQVKTGESNGYDRLLA